MIRKPRKATDSIRRTTLATTVCSTTLPTVSACSDNQPLHKNPAKPAVFLAGGIGITPFLGCHGHLLNRVRKRCAVTATCANSRSRALTGGFMKDV
jgi:hypothetical protein